MAVAHWLQTIRVQEALKLSETDIALHPDLCRDDVVDFLAHEYRKEHELGAVWLPPNRRYFLPETGIFAYPLPARRMGKPLIDFVMTMPFAPQLALVAQPRGAWKATEEWEREEEWARAQEFSVGARGNRVVVPWELIDAHGREEGLRSVQELRTLAVARLGMAERTNALVAQVPESTWV